MRRQPIVLYQDLLDDLSRHLPSDVISALSAGKSVDWWPDITPKQFACLALAKVFYKKCVDDTVASADSQALKNFLQVNDSCGKWRLDLRSTWEEEAVGTIKRHLHNFFHPRGDVLVPNLTYLFDRGRNGPGASIGSVGDDDYTKLYSSQLSCTKSIIYRAYRTSMLNHPMVEDAELFRNLKYGEPLLVEGNRLRFVPKQRDISRVICIEPTLNMYAQLGLASILEDRLRQYFGIDIATQPDKNRELASQGSKDGSFATIDLSSASDSMACGMLREVLDVEVFDVLNLLRSPVSVLPNGEQVKLNMISTMGNGYTFPLQTILFASVVSAAYDMHSLVRVRGGLHNPANFGVFGDDIVVDVRVYHTVCRLLELLGFKINAEKSFFEGPFRESCGGDFFRGHRVRGVYVKTLRTSQSRVVVLNRLHEWIADTGVPLTRTTTRLFRSIPKRFVPPWENHDAGIQVPYWCVDGMRRSKDLQSIVYRKWVARTRRIDLTTVQGLERQRRIYNPSGLFLSFLRGHIRNEQLSLRQRETLYVTKPAVAPSWDPPRTVLAPSTNWQRWNTAVWLTLSG